MVLPLAADRNPTSWTGVPVRLLVGDDWAEDHHDIEVMDGAGKVLAKRRLPEGVAGMTQLHELIGRYLPEDAADADVVVGIETDRGPWVAALVAAGYLVFPVNPQQASRYRERHGVSGAKSDGWDAHMLADMVRTDSHQLRPAAGDSPGAGAVKVVARTHKTLIWERTRAVQRLQHQLREYFPAVGCHIGSGRVSSAEARRGIVGVLWAHRPAHNAEHPDMRVTADARRSAFGRAERRVGARLSGPFTLSAVVAQGRLRPMIGCSAAYLCIVALRGDARSCR